MSEEVVTKRDISTINPDSIAELLEFRIDAINASVGLYAKNLDKIFGKLTKNLNEEKSKKYKEIRDIHIKEYETYIEKQVDQQLRQLFGDNSIAAKLVYISDNFDRYPSDLVNIHSAVDPIRSEFIKQLKTFEQSIDEKLESKTETLNQLTEDLAKSQESYESLRKSVQKKVLTIIKDVDSVDVEDLELNPETD